MRYIKSLSILAASAFVVYQSAKYANELDRAGYGDSSIPIVMLVGLVAIIVFIGALLDLLTNKE